MTHKSYRDSLCEHCQKEASPASTRYPSKEAAEIMEALEAFVGAFGELYDAVEKNLYDAPDEFFEAFNRNYPFDVDLREKYHEAMNWKNDLREKKFARERTANPNRVEDGTELVNAIFPDSMPGGPAKALIEFMAEFGGHLDVAAEELLHEEASRAGLEVDHISFDDVADALYYKLDDFTVETYVGELKEHTDWEGDDFMDDNQARVYLEQHRGEIKGVVSLEHAGTAGVDNVSLYGMLRLLNRGVADISWY